MQYNSTFAFKMYVYYIKRWSISLAIKEMQIKTINEIPLYTYYIFEFFYVKIPSADNNLELELSFIVGGNGIENSLAVLINKVFLTL